MNSRSHQSTLPLTSGGWVRGSAHALWQHLGAALAFSAGVVVGARIWFEGLQTVWPSDNATVQGLQFGSFLMVLGAILTWTWRGDVALRLGETFNRWREVVAAGLVLSLATWALVALSGSNAYSDADPVFEILLVPLGEELVFRGILLGWLLSRLSNDHTEPTAARLAVLFDGVAFGAAHASNVFFGAGDFVIVQVLAATALGLIFGTLRVRTRSLAAPILLHALVNGINLLG